MAVWLGQTNQLVVLGLLLAVMGLCTQNQAQLLFLNLEARFGQSTIQNYDSILRNNHFDSNVSFAVRFRLFVLFAIPLALSASYKQFVGGRTTVPVESFEGLQFGPVPPPNLFVGNGISPMVNATLPLYNTTMRVTNTSHAGTYGFNMYVVNDSMTAMIDAPFGAQLASLRPTRPGIRLHLTAVVNATIASLESTNKSSERQDPNYWTELETAWGSPYTSNLGPGWWSGLYVGNTLSWIFLSVWNTDNSETFFDNAIGFNVYRGWCTATWELTYSDIILEHAQDCNSAWSQPDELYDAGNTVITYSNYNIGQIYLSQIAEFITNAIPGISPPRSVWVSIVAAMCWARTAAWNGPVQWSVGRSLENQTATAIGGEWGYLQYTVPNNITSSTVTLQSSSLLHLVLAFQPILLLILWAGRAFFHSTALSPGFGLTALLAGVDRDSLDVLKGAAFDGELKRPVRVRISVRADPDAIGQDLQLVEYVLDGREKNSRIERGVAYG